MSDGNFKDISNADGAFPGPCAFLAAGYDPEQLSALRNFLDMQGYTNAPIRPCTAEQIGDPLERVLSSETGGVPLGEKKLPYVLVFSGLTYKDVQQVMQHFSTSGLPRPIFATTTPTNLAFTIKELLLHLLEEQKANQAMARSRKP